MTRLQRSLSLQRQIPVAHPRAFRSFVALPIGLLVALAEGLGCGSAPAKAPEPPLAVAPAPAVASGVAPIVPRFAAEPAPPPDFVHPAREQQLAALAPRLAESIDAFYAAQKPPSLAVAFVADGQVVLSRVLGMADAAAKKPADARTLYRIGSVTKTFTAALVLALRDGGLLELDRPAEEYLPELAKLVYPFPDAARITLRHLLTHSSGLPRIGNFDYTRPDAQVTEAVLFGAIADAALEAAPGVRYAYSNFGMSLAGFLAGRMSPEGSLRAALAQRVTAPLGMTSTTFEPSVDATLPGAPLVATGYEDRQSLRIATSWRLGESEAAGGLWSSLDDMARWVSFQLSAWPPRPGPEIGPLRRSSLREQHVATFPVALNASLESHQVKATASGIGLGWHTRQSCEYEHLVEHGGAIDGFKASVAFAPERGFGVIILANAIDTNTDALQAELLALAAPVLGPRRALPAPDTLALLSELGASFETCPESAYATLFNAGFRSMVPPAQHAAICAQFSQRHGRCAFAETVSLATPHQGEFLLRCERGAIRASAAVLTAEGRARFSGLMIRSTGFPPSPAVVKGVKQILELYQHWDDALFARSFAKEGVRDRLRAGFIQVHAEAGSCKLAAGAAEGLQGNGEQGAVFPIDCERGGPKNLVLDLDAQGKVISIFFRPRDDADAGQERCAAAPR
jgi:CubicO group peptidase (beta-lactamase class C family)